MKKSVFTLLLVSAALMLVSCATMKKMDAFASIYDEKPEVLLIMPPINNSDNVEAKDYFYTTMNVPLAECGYYVLPPAACYSVFQRESAYDAERFLEADLKKFNQLFGADVCVFTVINSWTKSYLGSNIQIELQYIFRSAKTNEILFVRDASVVCSTQSKVRAGGLIGALITVTADAVKTAVADYVKVAIQCNNSAFLDFPAGKYHPKYGADGEESARGKAIFIRTNY